jgi:hypothetical protein
MATTPKVTMRQALSDPKLLGSVLAGESWRAWRILLIALMGEALTDEERPIFTALTGREHEPNTRVEEFWGVIGRRGGKSRAISTLACYLALLVDYTGIAAMGEKMTVLLLAQNSKQASINYNYIRAIIKSVPMFDRLIASETSDCLSLRNGVNIEVRAASFRGTRGLSSVAVILDEVAYFYSEDNDSRNPDTQIIAALKPSLATTGGLIVGISSPYARRGSLWDAYSHDFGEMGDSLVLVAQGETRALNPSLPQRVIDRAYEKDPINAAAEFGALFRTDVEMFVTKEAVDAVVVPGRFEMMPVKGIAYRAFCDPAGGGGKDSFTLGISYRNAEGINVLSLLRETRPPFDPSAVCYEYASILKAYHTTKCMSDKYAGEWPVEQMRKLGITLENNAAPKSQIYQDALSLINSGAVQLLDNKRLILQLVGLERRTSRVGKDQIAEPPGSHDDLANSALGSLVACALGHSGQVIISDDALRNIQQYFRRDPWRDLRMGGQRVAGITFD